MEKIPSGSAFYPVSACDSAAGIFRYLIIEAG